MTGWGTIALAVVTFVTVMVTLHMASEADKKARKERLDRQLAEARLIITGAPKILPALSVGQGRNQHNVQFSLANYSPRPVIRIEAEVWTEGAPLDAACSAREDEMCVQVKEREMLEVAIVSAEPQLRLAAWRISWTDADGYAWCVDQPQQLAPLPYEGGPPRPDARTLS